MRYRTEGNTDVVARFNERYECHTFILLNCSLYSVCPFIYLCMSCRFILSLATCPSCLVLDDDLNVLPISSANANIEPLPPKSSVSSNIKPLHTFYLYNLFSVVINFPCYSTHRMMPLVPRSQS